MDFTAICTRLGLSAISVTVHPALPQPFCIFLRYQKGRCVNGYGDTFDEALAVAEANLATEREAA